MKRPIADTSHCPTQSSRLQMIIPELFDDLAKEVNIPSVSGSSLCTSTLLCGHSKERTIGKVKGRPLDSPWSKPRSPIRLEVIENIIERQVGDVGTADNIGEEPVFVIAAGQGVRACILLDTDVLDQCR